MSRRPPAEQVAPKRPPGSRRGPALPDGDGPGQPDLTQLLGIPLHMSPHHGEVLVDPDVDAPAERLLAVPAAHHHEALLVLRPHRIEEFVESVGTRLPVGPHHGHRTRILLGGRQRRRQQLGHGLGIGPVLDREHVAGVVPRRSRNELGRAGRRAGEGEPLKFRAGHDNEYMLWSLMISGEDLSGEDR